MSRIVKSAAVVDDRTHSKRTIQGEIEASIDMMPVIKSRIFHYTKNPYLDETLVMPDKQGYLDELNRIKVEIAESRTLLRRLRRETDEAAEEEARREPEGEPALTGPEAAAEAERILADARKQADGAMAEAAAEAVRIREEAEHLGYMAGFDKGFAQAMDEFKAENDPKMQQLGALLEELSNYREEMIAQNERDLLEVVFTVAEKILGHEIKSEPRSIAGMLYKTLDDNRREENLRITLSPDLMPAEAKVSAAIKKMITDAAPNAMVYVEKDLDEGTCYVETDKGITDLSVKTQLDNAKKLLEV